MLALFVNIGADFRKSQWMHAPIPLSSLPSLLSRLIPSLPFPLVPFSFPFSSPLLTPPLPLEVGPLNTDRGSVGALSALSSLSGVWGRSPSGNWIWCILALKSDNQFYSFSWESIDHSVCIFSNCVCDIFSSGCTHPSTLCLWVHWHPRHPVSRRLFCVSNFAK